jgi:hypothetical protein
LDPNKKNSIADHRQDFYAIAKIARFATNSLHQQSFFQKKNFWQQDYFNRKAVNYVNIYLTWLTTSIQNTRYDISMYFYSNIAAPYTLGLTLYSEQPKKK